jgi:hypothetical protein
MPFIFRVAIKTFVSLSEKQMKKTSVSKARCTKSAARKVQQECENLFVHGFYTLKVQQKWESSSVRF